MGYSLSSKNKYFSCKLITFSNLLHLAFLFGWKPRGTEPPTFDHGRNIVIDSSDWDGDYFGNSFQTVTEEDGEEIAASLKKALQFIPDTDFALKELIYTARKVTLEELIKGGLVHKGKVSNQTPEEQVDRLINVFAGGKDYLKKFIDFCEDGKFLIS
jgi:hypothetical protein